MSYKTTYETSKVLNTGQLLRVSQCCREWPASFHAPREMEVLSERFYLDDVEVEREELPSEVTDDFIEEMYNDNCTEVVYNDY